MSKNISQWTHSADFLCRFKRHIVLNVPIKAYHKLFVKNWTVYRRWPPMNLIPKGLSLDLGRWLLWLTGSLPCISVHYIFAILLTFWVWEWILTPLRLEITVRKHLSVIWRHIARINRLDKPYLAECELRITNQLNLASSIQSSKCRSILEIPMLIIWNPKFWKIRRNYFNVCIQQKTFFHCCKIYLVFFCSSKVFVKKFIFFRTIPLKNNGNHKQHCPTHSLLTYLCLLL